MQSLLPERWRSRSGQLSHALVLNVRDRSEIEILRRRRHRERSLGLFSMDGAMLKGLPARWRKSPVLRLPARAVLEREVRLPAAAERHVADILRRDMDRLTPFAADAIYWAGRVIESDSSDGRLTVRLAIILKSGVQPLLDRLAEAGLRPSVAEVIEPGGGLLRIVLDHSIDAAKRRRRRMLAAVGGLSIVLALLAIVLTFVQQSMTLAACEARIVALRPEAEEAVTLRRRIAADLALDAAIAAESGRSGDPLQAIAMLTQAVPDGSFLTTLSVRRSELAFRGESLDAVQLIGALAAVKWFVNPAFADSVTRSSDGGRELFSIRTELRPSR